MLEMVCFVRGSVEVIDDFGGSGGLEPVGGKTHIVNTSLGRLPVFFNNAGKNMSFTCVGSPVCGPLLLPLSGDRRSGSCLLVI